jgi:hypothetical protein
LRYSWIFYEQKIRPTSQFQDKSSSNMSWRWQSLGDTKSPPFHLHFVFTMALARLGILFSLFIKSNRCIFQSQPQPQPPNLILSPFPHFPNFPSFSFLGLLKVRNFGDRKCLNAERNLLKTLSSEIQPVE